MVLNKNNFTIFFLLFFTGVAFAQKNKTIVKDSTKTEQLDEFIVTATRTKRQLSSLPLPGHIVSSKEIGSMNAQRLNDILDEQTGLITVNDHGNGIQMQGMASDYTLILIDGVPLVGRTAGTLDLSRVTVGNIKQIEIVKGASSSLYGSEAFAGVINIITEDPKEGFRGSVNGRFGTFTSSDLSANINYKKNKFGITGFVNRYDNKGYDLDKTDDLKTLDPYNNYTFSVKADYDFSDKTSLLVSGKYFTENQDYVPTLELKGENSTNEWSTHVKFNHEHNEKWKSYIDFYTTRYKTDSYLNNLDNSRYSESFYNQLLVRPEIRMTYNPSKKSSFIGGVGFTHETLNRTYFSNKPEFNAPYVYIQYDVHPIAKLNLIMGARYDSHNEYESQFSPKVAFRYAFNDKIALKGSVGYGYKAPDFRQLYLDFTNPTAGYTVIGYNRVSDVLPQLEADGVISNILVPISEFNGALKAESSLSFNIGLQLKPISNLTFEVNVFRNNTKNLIDTQVIARKSTGQNVYSYKNISSVYTDGLEFNTKWKPTNQLSISGGYQLLFAKDKDAIKAFKDGKVFARLDVNSSSFELKEEDYFGLFNRSRHMANIKLFYSIPQWALDANIRGKYRSKYGIRDSNNSGYLDGYDTFVDGHTIWDFAVNKTFFKNYRLSVGIDNVLDFTDPQNISNIAGRTIYGKFNIQF